MHRLIIAGVAIALVVLPRVPLAAQLTAASPSAVLTAVDVAGGIRLVNRSTTARHVELRAARGGDCANGPSGRLQSVAAGATIVIRSSQPLRLRRRIGSATGARPTGPWEIKAMRGGVIEEVVL